MLSRTLVAGGAFQEMKSFWFEYFFLVSAMIKLPK